MQLERPWLNAWPKGVQRKMAYEDMPLYSILTDSARRSPNRACLSYQGRTMTYEEVDKLSSKFAGALLALGLRKGDRVAIFLPNIPQFVIGYFGILKAGGVVATCSPLYKTRELEGQIRDSGAAIVIAARDVVKGSDLFKSLEECRARLPLKHVITTSVTDYLPGFKKPLAGFVGVKNVRRKDSLDFATLIDSASPVTSFPEVNSAEEVAILQYTGGTTGTAKGAMLTHTNLYSNAVYLANFVPIKEDDVSLAVLPLYHIYGMTVNMNAPLYAGARIVLLPQFHVAEVMKTIQKEHVTLFSAVPTMYIALIHHPQVKKFDLRTVRACVSGGAPLPIEVRRRFNELTGGNLVEGYGVTEASPVTHCNPVHDGVVKEGSIGIPLPETDARIVDSTDSSKVMALGEVGELAVKGPQVMKGYWNQKGETDLVLKEGWLLTGDIARMDADGYFFIVDRKKDMVDVGGLKVYPREVEELLFTHPAVKEAAVVGMPDEFLGEAVKAFVVLKDPNAKVSEKEIVDFCAERVAKWKVPKKVEFVNELPKTLVGKVLRRALKTPSAPQS